MEYSWTHRLSNGVNPVAAHFKSKFIKFTTFQTCFEKLKNIYLTSCSDLANIQ